MTKILGSEFKPGPTGDSYAEYDGFVVSFNDKHPMDGGFQPDTPDGETALIVDGKYLILNGDWRMAYSEIAPQGAGACLNFFNSKAQQFKSSWSE